MCYQCIALILNILIAVAMNAAINIAPALHLPGHQTKTMHSGDVILPWGHQKVLGGGANSPPMQPSLRHQNSRRTLMIQPVTRSVTASEPHDIVAARSNTPPK